METDNNATFFDLSLAIAPLCFGAIIFFGTWEIVARTERQINLELGNQELRIEKLKFELKELRQ